MAEFRHLLADLGYESVQTLIQSGNAVFSTTQTDSAVLQAAISQRIQNQFALHVPVIVRTSAEIVTLLADNPFLSEGLDESMLHVALLQHLPTADLMGALDPNRSSPDRFVVKGGSIYLYTPNGQADTKLTTSYFDSRLKTVSTTRNWRTMQRLGEMAIS